MSIFNQKATSGGGSGSEIPSEGNHAGALVAIIDLGTHTTTYKETGKPDRVVDVRKLFIAFELDEPVSGATYNHIIGKEYTLATSPKGGLRKMLESMRGKAYQDGEEIDVSKALGKPCLVNIIHKVANSGKSYAKLENVGPMPKGMAAHKPKVTPVIWEIGCGRPFPTETWLPGWFLNQQFAPLSRIVEASKEMRGQNGSTPAQAASGSRPSAPMAPAPSMDPEEAPF